MAGKDVYKCTKCCRPYKLPSALSKHEAKCVPRVNRDALHLPGTSINRELVKVTHAPREQTTKPGRNAKRPGQKRRSAESTGEVKQKKERVKSLLEQADEEARWQLIRCNVNEILDDSLSSQLQQVTQQIPSSKLSTKHQTNSWWSAAKHSPPRIHVSRSSTVVTEETHQLNDESTGSDGADGTVGDANVATAPTSYRERTTLMSNLKGYVCSTPQPEILHSSNKVKSAPCTPLTSKSLVNNELFSDIQIKTSGGETVNGHKAFFYLAYPTMGPVSTPLCCVLSLATSVCLSLLYSSSSKVTVRFACLTLAPLMLLCGWRQCIRVTLFTVSPLLSTIGLNGDVITDTDDVTAEQITQPLSPILAVDTEILQQGGGHAGSDITDKAGSDITNKAGSDITDRTGSDITNKAGSDITNRAGSDITNKAGNNITNKAGSDITNKAGSDITNRAGNDITNRAGSDITNRAVVVSPQMSSSFEGSCHYSTRATSRSPTTPDMCAGAAVGRTISSQRHGS